MRRALALSPATTPPPKLLGLPTRPYHQEVYVTCLDLGDAGAVFTCGWDKKVEIVGAEAKAYKKEINTVWITRLALSAPRRSHRRIRNASRIYERPLCQWVKSREKNTRFARYGLQWTPPLCQAFRDMR